MLAKDLTGLEIRTNSNRLVDNMAEYIRENGSLEFEGEQFTPVGMLYVEDEYVANMRARHEDIPRIVYQDAFCHTDEAVDAGWDAYEVPRYRLTVADGVVVGADQYDYDNVRLLKALED